MLCTLLDCTRSPLPRSRTSGLRLEATAEGSEIHENAREDPWTGKLGMKIARMPRHDTARNSASPMLHLACFSLGVSLDRYLCSGSAGLRILCQRVRGVASPWALRSTASHKLHNKADSSTCRGQHCLRHLPFDIAV